MDEVTTLRAGPITTVTMNRPAKLNAINSAMHHALEAAFNDFAGDAQARICVLTGAGERAFCAGSDVVSAQASGFDADLPAHGYGGLAERFDCAKPIIAAVNGLAFGGGFELALACDLIIAADHAQFSLPEPLIGAVALAGGLHRLARQIGLKQAMGLALSSRRLTAAEALGLGLVNEVVPGAQLSESVARWCADILAGAPLAIEASKATMMRGLGEPDLAGCMARQADYPEFARWAASADMREGIAAFAQKRAPEWVGR